MEHTKTVESPTPSLTGKTPEPKQTLHNHNKGKHQNKMQPLDGLDKYFQVLPLVENFLNETNPKLKKDSGIFLTPYQVVSFIVRSIHEILKEKLDKPLGKFGVRPNCHQNLVRPNCHQNLVRPNCHQNLVSGQIAIS
jgi:hypothetical protein